MNSEISTHSGVSLSSNSGVCVAKIKGDLDHHTAKFIRGEIDREIASARPHRLIIDFSGVTFMDSSGIGLIMGRYKLMQDYDGEVIIASPPDYIRKVLRLAGVDKLARITDDISSLIPKEKIPQENKEKEVTADEQSTAAAN